MRHADTVHGASNFAARYARVAAQHNKRGACIAEAQQAWRQQASTSVAAEPTLAPDTEPTLGPDGEEVCYICLSSEGCMLVNVCKCRWARVHQACLSAMVKHNECRACTVCKSPLQYPACGVLESTDLLELMYRAYPCAMLAHALFSLLIALAALCTIVWSTLYVEESRTTTVLCALVLGYTMINTIVILHHTPLNQQWLVTPLRVHASRACGALLGLLTRLTRLAPERSAAPPLATLSSFRHPHVAPRGAAVAPRPSHHESP